MKVMKPELRIDGEVVATGGAVMMGLSEDFVMTFTHPSHSTDVVSNKIEAGEYLGVALAIGAISKNQMEEIKAKLEATKAKLEAKDFSGLTKDDILGNLLYTTSLAYFAELDAMNYITAKTMGISLLRLPSEAIFSYDLQIATSFYDTPISASPGGLAMDVDKNVHVVKALDGDNNKKVQFMLASGMNSSALEHSVPEQLFSTPENPAEGISAVKALQIANDQGIPIYTVNQSNIDTILPQLQVDASVKADIINAVNAGKEVTVPQTNITFSDWTGCGYIIIDPDTGAGAYMISGGLSGGLIQVAMLLGFGLALLVIAVLIGPVALAIVSLLLPIYLGLLAWMANDASDQVRKCVTSISVSILLIWSFVLKFSPPYDLWGIKKRILSILVGSGATRIGRECFGIGTAY